ncbi:hypothetical protein HR060_17985 [Catenovulum sp. SM1970]|uniref:hypothetical protein n=1 Tax=Marinifaba aquimaris TaxID=2741323 RepID=UPI001572C8C5|nr:hypothetical protein [Marinifaba aquimaris]NTS78735.1 hypothetical protein [Marinifaba aquimaris]
MENILSALQVNAMLLSLALFVTFIVLGVTEPSKDREVIQRSRIENAFFAVACFAAFLVFLLG